MRFAGRSIAVMSALLVLAAAGAGTALLAAAPPHLLGALVCLRYRSAS